MGGTTQGLADLPRTEECSKNEGVTERSFRESLKRHVKATQNIMGLTKNKALGRKIKCRVSQLETNSSIPTSPSEIASQLNSYCTDLAKQPVHHSKPPALHRVKSVFHLQNIGEDEVLTINNDLSWKSHMQSVCRRMLAVTASIRRVRRPWQPNRCYTMHWFFHMQTTAL